MGLFDNFPYYNPYQLNLDWIIAMMRKFEADYNQLDPESFLRKSGGLVDGVLQMAENGAIDMNGKPLGGLKTAVNSGDALPFGQAEGLYLHKAGGKMSGTLDMDGNAITNIPAPVADSDAVNKKFVEDKIGTPEAPGAYLPLAGGMMSGDLNMDGHALTGIQNPINGLDAVNKTFVDGINGAIRQWALTSFAPSGYGLGGRCTVLDSWNAALNTGFYRCVGDSATGYAMFGFVIKNTDDYIVQLAWSVDEATDGYSIAVRIRTQDGFQPWEWINPPMRLGVEYRTTERFDGKVIYAQYFKVGTAVNGASVRKPAGSSAIIRHQSYIGSLPLPLGLKYIERSGYFAYTASRTDDGFYLITDSLSDGYGSGGYNWFEQMWYTK